MIQHSGRFRLLAILVFVLLGSVLWGFTITAQAALTEPEQSSMTIAESPLNLVAANRHTTERGIGNPADQSFPPSCQVDLSPAFVTNIPVPTAFETAVTSTIEVDGIETFIYDVYVTTKISHTYNGDLDVTLTSPQGTSVTLITDRGGSNDNSFANTAWWDWFSPTDTLPYITPPLELVTERTTFPNNVPLPALVPEEALQAFYGENPNGTWTLAVYDDRSADNGIINGWDISFNTLANTPITTSFAITNTIPQTIPNNTGILTSTLLIDGAPPGVILDLDLTTFITHGRPFDMNFALTGPNGRTVTVSTRNGLGNANVFNGTVFDDSADLGNPVPYNSANITTDYLYVNGQLAPSLVIEESLGSFIGEDPNGLWTFVIYDDIENPFGGSLNRWSLDFDIGDCPPPAPAITLEKTVGTTPGVCATTDTISVTVGTDVYYCYKVTNSGDITLANHDLSDSELGTIFTDLPYVLAPNTSVNTVQAGLTISTTINTTTTNTALWISSLLPPIQGGIVVTATDSATVNMLVPAIRVSPEFFNETHINPPRVTTDTFTLFNIGEEPLTYTLFEEVSTSSKGSGGVCQTPSDIPWLAIADTNGTIASDGSDFTRVTFNSAGLSDGTYTGNLCIQSNDPDRPLVAVPITLTVGNPAISLTTTVGTTSNICATTDTIAVPPGTTVYYCHEVTNTGNITLTRHDLVDSELGNIFADIPYDLAPGSRYSTVDANISIETIIQTDTVSSGVWTARTQPAGYEMVTGTCGVFPDISTTGTALNLTDDQEADILLPFSFQLYNANSPIATVGNNGFVLIGQPGADPTLNNRALPTDAFDAGVAIFWDDIDSETGNVYHGPYTIGSRANNLLSPAGAVQGLLTYHAFQWKDRPHHPGPTPSLVTFTQLLAAPGQGIDGYMVSCYNDTTFGTADDFGASATIGINQDENVGLQYSFNTPRPDLTGTFGIAFIPTGSAQQVQASDSATVTVLAPNIVVGTTGLTETHTTPPQITTDTFTIQNTGNMPLTYTIGEEATTLLDVEGNGVPQGRDVTTSQQEYYAKNSPLPSAWINSGLFASSRTRFYETGALPPTPLGGPVNLLLDDGIAEDIIGLTPPDEFVWFNRFTPNPADFPFKLTEIQLLTNAESGCSPTDVVDFYIYQDADSNPTNGATFVAAVLNQTIGTLGQLNSYPTDITLTGPGDVLILVANRTCDQEGQLPAALDTTASQQRSWVGYYNGPVPNPPTFPAPDLFGLIDSFGFPGNWTIRGVGIKGCITLSDLPWVSVGNPTGTIGAGDSATINVIFDSTALSSGIYGGNLCIQSNDPDEALASVPIELTVGPPTILTISTFAATPPTVPLGSILILGIATTFIALALRRWGKVIPR